MYNDIPFLYIYTVYSALLSSRSVVVAQSDQRQAGKADRQSPGPQGKFCTYVVRGKADP